MPSPSYFDVVYLNPDRQAVVPCRVTAPSAKVTLHREFPAKEIPANGTDIVYDMKRGFVYLQPHSDHQGVVYCKAEAGGKSQISVKYQLLYVEGESAFLPQPRLTLPACWEGNTNVCILHTLLLILSEFDGQVPYIPSLVSPSITIHFPPWGWHHGCAHSYSCRVFCQPLLGTSAPPWCPLWSLLAFSFLVTPCHHFIVVFLAITFSGRPQCLPETIGLLLQLPLFYPQLEHINRHWSDVGRIPHSPSSNHGLSSLQPTTHNCSRLFCSGLMTQGWANEKVFYRTT